MLIRSRQHKIELQGFVWKQRLGNCKSSWRMLPKSLPMTLTKKQPTKPMKVKTMETSSKKRRFSRSQRNLKLRNRKTMKRRKSYLH